MPANFSNHRDYSLLIWMSCSGACNIGACNIATVKPVACTSAESWRDKHSVVAHLSQKFAEVAWMKVYNVLKSQHPHLYLQMRNRFPKKNPGNRHLQTWIQPLHFLYARVIHQEILWSASFLLYSLIPYQFFKEWVTRRTTSVAEKTTSCCFRHSGTPSPRDYQKNVFFQGARRCLTRKVS